MIGWPPPVRSLVVAIGVLMGPWAGPATGQPSSTPTDAVDMEWTSGVVWGREIMASDRPGWPDWSDGRLFTTRRFDGGSLGVELARVKRFGSVDVGVAVDGYRELWSRAYGHLRIRATPDAGVLPGLDVRAEVFHALAGGWEVSANVRTMDFETRDVAVFGGGVARYVGAWYVRQVASVGRLAGASALSGALNVRRFIAAPVEYVELAGGVGSEVVLVGPGPDLDTRDTRFVQARLQRFLAGRWGVMGSLGYTTFEGAPSRIGISVGVMTRH